MMNDNKALERSGNITTHKVRMPHDLAIEAMQTILDYANDTKTDLVFVIAASMAMDALKREAQPNDPLTLEELREMDGEPVWIVEHPDWGHWELSAYAEDYFEDRDEDFYGMTMPKSMPDPMGKYGLHMLGWLAYRSKPDGGGEQ